MHSQILCRVRLVTTESRSKICNISHSLMMYVCKVRLVKQLNGKKTNNKIYNQMVYCLYKTVIIFKNVDLILVRLFNTNSSKSRDYISVI
jgi:hypothetical protein